MVGAKVFSANTVDVAQRPLEAMIRKLHDYAQIAGRTKYKDALQFRFIISTLVFDFSVSLVAIQNTPRTDVSIPKFVFT